MQKFSFFLQASVCILLTSFFSCSEKNNNDEVLKQMEESLINSSKTINYSTSAQLKELEQKTTEWATSDKGKIWFSKAELIAAFTRIRYDFIEDKKNKSNFNDNDLKEVYHNL